MSVITFDLDRSIACGLLRFSHETNLYYDSDTRKWYGEEINSDGWVDLTQDEVMRIVEELDLKNHISSILDVSQFPHKAIINYDTETGEWSGKEVCSYKRSDLDQDEVMRIVEEHELEDHIF